MINLTMDMKMNNNIIKVINPKIFVMVKNNFNISRIKIGMI
jgi:hypothetical protein